MTEQRKSRVIPQNGEAKSMMLDVASYEETLALLKILALGNREVEEGRVKPLAIVARRLRAKKTVVRL
jgi:hypothetical protein